MVFVCLISTETLICAFLICFSSINCQYFVELIFCFQFFFHFSFNEQKSSAPTFPWSGTETSLNGLNNNNTETNNNNSVNSGNNQITSPQPHNGNSTQLGNDNNSTAIATTSASSTVNRECKTIQLLNK